MEETAAFQELIGKVRAGDKDAAAEFVRQYEPAIRRAARIRIVDPRLAPLLDSSDVAQSVFSSFFIRAALGQYDLDKPAQVLSLLITMSRKKVAGYARKQSAARRDYRRISAGSISKKQLRAADPDPGQQAATDELIHVFRNRLTPDERQLADLRAQGCGWDAIAAKMGEGPEGLPKKLQRAINRIAHYVGLDEYADE